MQCGQPEATELYSMYLLYVRIDHLAVGLFKKMRVTTKVANRISNTFYTNYIKYLAL